MRSKPTLQLAVTCLTLVGVVIVLSVLLWQAYSRFAESRDRTLLYDIGRQLGYTDANLLVEHSYCWGVVNAHCGMFLHYTVPVSPDQFRLQVRALGMHISHEGGASGRSIFSDINSNNPRKLTVNGNDGFQPGMLQIPTSGAWEWILTNAAGRDLTISFYETSTVAAVYALDGRRITNNIVTVMVQTR